MVRIYSLLFIIAVILIASFVYFVWFERDVNLKNAFIPLIIEFIGSFILAVVAFLLGFKFQEHSSVKGHERKLHGEKNLLREELRRTLKRTMSIWNFRNETPSFYFDNGWVNPLYDLISANNRRWEEFLIDYKKSIKKPDTLTSDLLKFTDQMDEALVCAERLDTYLRQNIYFPAMAAIKESKYSADVINGDIYEPFNFLVYRAVLIGLKDTEIVSGLAAVPGVIDISTTVNRARNKIDEEVKNDRELSDIVDELKEYISQLNHKVESIRKRYFKNKSSIARN